MYGRPEGGREERVVPLAQEVEEVPASDRGRVGPDETDVLGQMEAGGWWPDVRLLHEGAAQEVETEAPAP